MGKQGILLEDGVDLPLVRRDLRDVDAVKEHLAAGRLFEAGDDPERCGLAAAAGAQQCQKLVFVDIQIDAAQHLLVIIVFRQVFEFNNFFHDDLLPQIRMTAVW